ncbi:Protein of unknown function [Hymenobacter gelipurpurascens]|uniref:DUF2490 domain-containing protein n=1 Tax=Hymenobacter gelipurpurascens TaxID=89968 RepID=A0A212T3W6_9BACT|nr:DUF2490 domain-containing protein [Hymenobacter gelipurpurascens]SNC60709.1 Protein of unknown function [Hymenobacter gelipurpurascens]
MKNRVFTAGLSCFLLVASHLTTQAQTPINPTQPWGSWFIGTVQLPGTPENKWGGFAEVQVRTNDIFRHYFYHELKAGLSYDVVKDFTATLAGGRYSTSDYKALKEGPLNREMRLWEQLVMNQYVGPVRFEHRYRVEQRWFSYRGDSTSFRNRLRYRLNAFLPLNAKTITAKTLFLSTYDEIFINPKGPVFERNRLYAGLGYQFNKHLTVQAGWVNQINYNLPTLKQGQFIPQITSAKNNIVLAVAYRLAHKSADHTQETLPSQQD